MDNQLKETQQTPTRCSRRHDGGGGNVNSNVNSNGNGNSGVSGNEDNDGGGRWVMGRPVWGR
jgi:hypothetical protein